MLLTHGANMKSSSESIQQMGIEINGFVDDLSTAVNMDSGIKKHYQKVLICGMGASAIGGEILSNSMYYSSKICVDTAKTMALPCWVNKNTLFVACSYSGNTFETISMYEMAVKEGLDTIVITSGGKLEELAHKNESQIFKIEGSPIQPRSAIGWFIGMLAAIIEDAGGPELRDCIRSILPHIDQYSKELREIGSIPWNIANQLNGRTPIIYAVPKMSAVAVRWKTQINENSKLIAFSGVMPEFNHNEIVGWCNDPSQNRFLPIVIDDRSDGEIEKTLNATIKALNDNGVKPIIVNTKGNTILERTIYALMLGDYTSLFIASNLNKDPLNVDAIVNVKRHLKNECEFKI